MKLWTRVWCLVFWLTVCTWLLKWCWCQWWCCSYCSGCITVSARKIIWPVRIPMQTLPSPLTDCVHFPVDSMSSTGETMGKGLDDLKHCMIKLRGLWTWRKEAWGLLWCVASDNWIHMYYGRNMLAQVVLGAPETLFVERSSIFTLVACQSSHCRRTGKHLIQLSLAIHLN